MTIIIKTYQSPVGELLVGSLHGKLCLCDWQYRSARGAIDRRIQNGLSSTYAHGNSQVFQNTIQQLEEYFSGRRTEFNIPLEFVGSPFQQMVWQALLKIPYGKTYSYLELSKALDNDNAIRAVATANGANALSIVVPCHRVIGTSGKLVGYAGGLTAKRELLQLEDALPATKQLSLF